MADTRSEEARAAARLAGIPLQSPAAIQPTTPRGILTDADWPKLATRLVHADGLQIFGVIPVRLVEAIASELQKDAELKLPEIEYFTPLPELVLTSNREFYSYASRWHSGYIGLRNLFMADHNDTKDEVDSQHEKRFLAFGVPSLSFNCAIRISTAATAVTTMLFTEFFSQGVQPNYVLQEWASSSTEITRHLDEVSNNGEPIRLREIRCHAMDDVVGDPQQALLRIGELVPLGSQIHSPYTLRPIAIVVVRCHSPAGLQVVLKKRSPLTDTDDFDRISLLSARIQETDVASALGTKVSGSQESDDGALEDLWLKASSPTPFLLPAASFLHAAQREVSATLGLHIPIERFIRRGFQLVRHESQLPQQLGFTIFTLDLVRSDAVDELRTAMMRNAPNLHRVLASEVYADERPLNRLLRQRKSWLIANCFS